MAHISDKDRTVFSEAHLTVLDNFTDAEHVQIEVLAANLKKILENAKQRQQEKLNKPY